MNTGTVLYITDAKHAPDPVELPARAAALGFDPRWVAVAGSAPGWPTPQDAMLSLAERGAHRIEFRAAHPEPAGKIRVSAHGYRMLG
ncbi:MAG: hypothetical protein GXP50_12620 [Deltaproteobacteria bacterium]|nr:hypothetical protein [Deltaproteobacteria bacterium]